MQKHLFCVLHYFVIEKRNKYSEESLFHSDVTETTLHVETSSIEKNPFTSGNYLKRNFRFIYIVLFRIKMLCDLLLNLLL